MYIESTELTGQRAKLVPMNTDDIEGLFEAGTDTRICTYMLMKVETIEDAKRLVDDARLARDQGLEFPYIVLDQETDMIVGSNHTCRI